MPWRAASPMTLFIPYFLRDALSITELCQLYEVSRKTGYKYKGSVIGRGGRANSKVFVALDVVTTKRLAELLHKLKEEEES
jgi:hypothetical protein